MYTKLKMQINVLKIINVKYVTPKMGKLNLQQIKWSACTVAKISCTRSIKYEK